MRQRHGRGRTAAQLHRVAASEQKTRVSRRIRHRQYGHLQSRAQRHVGLHGIQQRCVDGLVLVGGRRMVEWGVSVQRATGCARARQAADVDIEPTCAPDYRLSATNTPSEQSSGGRGWRRNHNVRVVHATRLPRQPDGCTPVFQLLFRNDRASQGECGRGQAIVTTHHSSIRS
ncbi:hypothetical protein XAC3810_10036 [Xanthomonas citri pv. citri]|uniref:Uncharacterized protein n=1 Tax=Xanthomonas citri pv. citri TaxID=611301 RepID=A0A0U5BMW4_XANCI|nr:hypothetical protein XAC3824_10034 [Xanthomonas citri pv. citri]CEE16116.1 hypothetical protein XAC9322_10036 [Xanthomonas citri pv. citri]CEE16154.1 hypothetical protein XAC1083_10036 [Xanthomonas citri pv. citri]CEE16888.1 hypothetical protein XAC902_10036 [Xanthomonas citri pv. citri]CEE21482.1 hypothetical protein XAC3810_10036 [Xanthomonas citri pv. citri]